MNLISGQNIDRKIVVIFANDSIAYSKHKQADERETIFALHECDAILLGWFKKYGGRLFNTGGDFFLGPNFPVRFLPLIVL